MTSLAMRCMRMRAQIAPSPVPGSATWRSSAPACSSFSSTELKAISFSRLWISRAERGVPGRSIGLICTRIVS